MATLIIDENEDPVAAARAVASALSLWLTEQPKPETAPPARAHCKYDEAGNLRTLTVTLEDA